MNMKNKNLIQFSVFAVLVFLTTNAHAGPGRWHSGPHQEGREKGRAHFEEIYKELGLTPEQQQQLKAQKEGHRQVIKEQRGQIQAKRQELGQALQAPEVNMPKVQALFDQLKALLIQKEDQRLEGILEVRKILTPEQFTKFHEKMQDKREKGKEFFKGRHKKQRTH